MNYCMRNILVFLFNVFHGYRIFRFLVTIHLRIPLWFQSRQVRKDLVDKVTLRAKVTKSISDNAGMSLRYSGIERELIDRTNQQLRLQLEQLDAAILRSEEMLMFYAESVKIWDA